jgi:hypothetical protein
MFSFHLTQCRPLGRFSIHGIGLERDKLRNLAMVALEVKLPFPQSALGGLPGLYRFRRKSKEGLEVSLGYTVGYRVRRERVLAAVVKG